MSNLRILLLPACLVAAASTTTAQKSVVDCAQEPLATVLAKIEVAFEG